MHAVVIGAGIAGLATAALLGREGYDVTVVEQADEVRTSIGVTGQSACLDELLTGRENLMLFGRLRGMRRRAARQRADELIEQFELGHAANRPVQTYSGGMRRRVDIAIGLVTTPKVLFLDEPTAGLDPIGAAAFDQLTKDLQATLGLTVFLITHDLDTLYEICDRVAVLAKAAESIGEQDEYLRCLDLLDDCDPAARGELGL